MGNFCKVTGISHFISFWLLLNLIAFDCLAARGNPPRRSSNPPSLTCIRALTSNTLNPSVLHAFLGMVLDIRLKSTVTVQAKLLTFSRQYDDWVLVVEGLKGKTRQIYFSDIESLNYSIHTRERVFPASRKTSPPARTSQAPERISLLDHHTIQINHDSEEVLPKSPEELNLVNQSAMQNNERKIRNILPLLASAHTEAAFFEILKTSLSGHFFHLPPFLIQEDSDQATLANHRFFREHALRQQSHQLVCFGNALPPHWRDLDEVLRALFSKVDDLCSKAATEIHSMNKVSKTDPRRYFPAYVAAFWLRREITLIQPAVDTNTRTARLMSEWVVARIEHLLHEKNMNVSIPWPDLTQKEVIEKSITYTTPDSKQIVYFPFHPQTSWDFKDDILYWHYIEVAQFAASNQRYFLFVDHNDPTDTSAQSQLNDIWSLAITPEQLFSDEASNESYRAAWDTIKAYHLARIAAANTHDLMKHPAIKAEVRATIELILAGSVK